MSYFSDVLLRAAGVDGVQRNLNRDDIAGNRTLFNEMIVTERTPLIEINSALGISVLRDVTAVTNTGTVTNSGGENILSTGATTGSTASLTTVEYGRYYPGTSAQQGMGIRAPGTYTGTAFAEWGYFGAADGFGFGTDATGTYVFYTRNSTQTKVYQSSWSLDVMDGTGPSGATFDKANGNIFQLNFSWYGYGVIEWTIVTDLPSGRQGSVVVHRYTPTTTNSIQNPNQPIAMKISNGDTTTDYTVYGGGRQFSVYGRYVPSIRKTHENRLSVTSVGTTFVPLVTFRRKAGFESYPVRFHQVGLLSNAELLWEIIVGGTLTGASFGAITNVPTTETALEVDIAATAITGGQKTESGFVSTSGGGATSRGGFSSSSYEVELPGTTVFTLCARTITGTATVSSILGMEEEW
jgi:hypothetical protein